jgi:hypothetical protein
VHAVNTLKAVDERSIRRAAVGRHRVWILGGFVLASFVILAALLQIQQNRLHAYINQQCAASRANAIRANEVWAALGQIEMRNQFVNAQIRSARLAVSNEAKLTVPVCQGG